MRAKLSNLRTGVTRNFQFNPTQWEEAIGAEFARQTVPGLSHQVMQFINTRNREVTLDLFFSNANYPSGSKGGVNPILSTRRWLRSLVHPRRGGGRVTGGAPRVLFTWPAFITFTAFIVDLKFTYRRFNWKGEPTQMVVAVSLEEVRDDLRLMEEVTDLENE
jgi:hypothetical protein